MPNPFEEGGSTRTMDMPPVRADEGARPPPPGPRLWQRPLVIGALVVLALIVLLVVLR